MHWKSILAKRESDRQKNSCYKGSDDRHFQKRNRIDDGQKIISKIAEYEFAIRKNQRKIFIKAGI